MIISGLEANKMHFRHSDLVTNKAKWAFLLNCVTSYCFIMT